MSESAGATESAFVRLETRQDKGVGGVMVFLCEKVTEREAKFIEEEMASAASKNKWKLAADLSQVTILSSSGLGMLVNLNKQFRVQKGRLVVCGLSDDITQVMKLTRLDSLLTIVPDRKAAEKALDK